ncbi:MAG: hypothetical protein ACRC9P_10340 [Bacteroides sp.]
MVEKYPLEVCREGDLAPPILTQDLVFTGKFLKTESFKFPSSRFRYTLDSQESECGYCGESLSDTLPKVVRRETVAFYSCNKCGTQLYSVSSKEIWVRVKAVGKLRKLWHRFELWLRGVLK